MAEQNNQILLETKDLQKHFPIKDFFGRKKQAVKAVDGITFQIRKVRHSVLWASPAAVNRRWAEH